jgi:hypothetical protein
MALADRQVSATSSDRRSSRRRRQARSHGAPDRCSTCQPPRIRRSATANRPAGRWSPSRDRRVARRTACCGTTSGHSRLCVSAGIWCGHAIRHGPHHEWPRVAGCEGHTSLLLFNAALQRRSRESRATEDAIVGSWASRPTIQPHRWARRASSQCQKTLWPLSSCRTWSGPRRCAQSSVLVGSGISRTRRTCIELQHV